MNAQKTTGERVFAFNAVGVVGFGVQTIALWLLVRGVHLPHPLACALAVETAVLHNFVCHWCWTWSDRRREFFERLVRFNLTNGAVSLVVNVALMALLQHAWHVHYLLANLAGVAAGSIANFILGDRVVFPAYRPKTRAISSRSAGSSGVRCPDSSI